MSDIILTCPSCKFSKAVDPHKIPRTTKRVTCPKCQHLFPYTQPPTIDQFNQTIPPITSEPIVPPSIEPEGDLRKPQNLRFALLFLLIFAALLMGRLYFSHRAVKSPTPNFITASEYGVATLWLDRIMVTDHAGNLVKQIQLPEDVTPTQMIWAGEDLWVADYDSKNILIASASGQRWLPLKGPEISAHFKVAPDFSNNRVFVSAGHSIHVYDLQGRFSHSFGKEGERPGEFKFPNQFLLNDSGNLLIANTKSPAIDEYAPDGTFIARLVKPMGDSTYRYPTNVVLTPDRIVTLEADGFLEKGRIALYDLRGRYLGRNEIVADFQVIGDIAAWEGRILATDMVNSRVYAFAADDLHFLGDYSEDLKRLGEESRVRAKTWNRLATLSLLGMLALLMPIVYFYYKFRAKAGVDAKSQFLNQSANVETVEVNRRNALDRVSLDTLGPIEFIAVETHIVVDILSFVCLGIPILGMTLLKPLLITNSKGLTALFLMGIFVVLLAGLLLCLRSSWGCPVSLKKARKLLETLLKNKGVEVMVGVQQVGIGFCVDKNSLLLLMTPRQLTVAEFDWFGQVRHISRIGYEEVRVETVRFVMPAITLIYGGKKKMLQALDRSFLDRLRTAIEKYQQTISSGSVSAAPSFPKTVADHMEAIKQFHPKAALFSALFPGLGQFYKRHIIRGTLFMLGFVPVALSLAVNIEPAMNGSLDWAKESIINLLIVLSVGVPVYVVSLWDALRN